jgi:hypothetical protein
MILGHLKLVKAGLMTGRAEGQLKISGREAQARFSRPLGRYN